MKDFFDEADDDDKIFFNLWIFFYVYNIKHIKMKWNTMKLFFMVS